MIFVPSWRMLGAIAGLSFAAVGLLVFPGGWPLLVAANLALLLLAIIDLAVSPKPSVLKVVRIAPEKLSLNSEQKITLRIRNTSRVKLRVRVKESVPAALGQPDLERSGAVPNQDEVEWEYTVLPKSRGRYSWGSIHLRYHTLLGLWERGKTEPAPGLVRVFPDLSLLDRYELLARSNRLSAMGIRRVRLRGVSSEFESLREYASGDDVRQMDWKATARRGRLIVRNREAERNQTVLLLVDSGRLMNATEGEFTKLDHAVNAALLLAHVALARGDRVGLCTFSSKVHDWLIPRSNMVQNRLIAEALCDLRGDYTESDHGRCLKFLASRYPKRSLLVVLTDFVDGTTAADMVAHLRLAARQHVVLFAAMKDAFLERASRRDPQTVREGFRKAAAVDLLRERREVLEKIRHVGGYVVDTEPGEVAPDIINNYLKVMLGGIL